MAIVEEYWEGVVRRLQLEADVFNRLIEHHGEVGSANEASISGVVRQLLPPTMGVGSGIVIDSKNGRSKQCDMIIFSQRNQPSLLAQTNQALFPVEVVELVVEVKTTVTKDEIDDSIEKAEALRCLQPVNPSYRTPEFAFFGFTCGNAPATVSSYVRAASLRPDFGCVIRPGLFWTDRPHSRTGLVPLHARAADGSAISGTWTNLDDLPRDRDGKTSYPGFSPQPYGRSLLAGDPGRALLLFCGEVLRTLSDRESLGDPWLKHYLSATAAELLDEGTP